MNFMLEVLFRDGSEVLDGEPSYQACFSYLRLMSWLKTHAVLHCQRNVAGISYLQFLRASSFHAATAAHSNRRAMLKPIASADVTLLLVLLWTALHPV